MDRIDEIEIQNLQDGWSSMYMILATSIKDYFGDSGVDLIREAIRRYGNDLGLTVQKLHLDNDIEVNLENLFNFKTKCHPDPRFRENVIKLNKQVYLCDMITCPLSSYWSRYGDRRLGRLYCEEFYHSFYSSFCYKKSQINVSRMLTHEGDNHCQFAIYFRPANLDEKLVPQCFGNTESDLKDEFVTYLPKLNAKEKYKYLWLKMYYFMLEVADERYSDEGRAVISSGLQKAAISAYNFVKKRAYMTGNTLNQDYFSANYPVDVEMAYDEFWKKNSNHDAKKIFSINFNNILKKQFRD